MDQTLLCPKRPPYQEYITAIELACQSLRLTDAKELRADISRILRQSKPPKSNLTREELKALKQLKSDKNHIILMTNRGWH